MNENEKKLLEIVRENDNPGAALMTASLIILDFLGRLGSSSVQEPADLRVLS